MSQHQKQNDRCSFCSFASVQERTAKKESNGIISAETCYVGLECNNCHSCACVYCLNEVVSTFPKCIQATDVWCKNVMAFLTDGSVPPQFIGHCCELKLEHQKLGLDKAPIIEKTKFDGHLHFPEFGVIVDSPFTCIDVHGLVGGSPTLPPVWHCVFSHEAASQFASDDVYPDGSDAIIHEDWQQYELLVQLPHTVHSKKKYKIRMRTFYQSKTFDPHLAGTNSPTSDNIKHCMVISVNDPRPHDVHIEILTGQFANSSIDKALLLFRLYNVDHNMDNKHVQSLYEQCQKNLCKRSGFEANRVGGSSGLTKPDADFFRFLHSPSSFPRKAGGVKCVRHNRTWVCVYLRVHTKPGKGRAAMYSYSAPRPGGQFDVSNEMLQRFPFLYTFAETKLLAATVIDQINKAQNGLLIQERAIQYELSMLEHAKYLANATLENPPSKKAKPMSRMLKNISRRRKPRQSILRQYISLSKHTLVQHPVGYHRDYFSAGKECLENKFCFAVHGGHSSSTMGRGGGGPKQFVAAILDWAH